MQEKPPFDPCDYMTLVLDHIEKDAYYFHRISDWTGLCQTFLSRSQAASTLDDLYPLIRELLRYLRDNHSFLSIPQELKDERSRFSQTMSQRLPQFSMVDTTWGYLSLTAFIGSDSDCQQYIDSAYQSLEHYSHVRGWIVDCRKNRGGNMWPMLTVVGVLLGNGTLGKFINRDGTEFEWGYRDGASVYEGEVVYKTQYQIPNLPSDLPIALLLSDQTTSSGEVIAISILGHSKVRSFGQPTCGVPTANSTYTLPDGAILALTTSVVADRHGVRYETSIAPDVIIKAPHSENCVKAAVEWLSQLA